MENPEAILGIATLQSPSQKTQAAIALLPQLSLAAGAAFSERAFLRSLKTLIEDRLSIYTELDGAEAIKERLDEIREYDKLLSAIALLNPTMKMGLQAQCSELANVLAESWAKAQIRPQTATPNGNPPLEIYAELPDPYHDSVDRDLWHLWEIARKARTGLRVTLAPATKLDARALRDRVMAINLDHGNPNWITRKAHRIEGVYGLLGALSRSIPEDQELKAWFQDIGQALQAARHAFSRTHAQEGPTPNPKKIIRKPPRQSQPSAEGASEKRLLASALKTAYGKFAAFLLYSFGWKKSEIRDLTIIEATTTALENGKTAYRFKVRTKLYRGLEGAERSSGITDIHWNVAAAPPSDEHDADPRRFDAKPGTFHVSVVAKKREILRIGFAVEELAPQFIPPPEVAPKISLSDFLSSNRARISRVEGVLDYRLDAPANPGNQPSLTIFWDTSRGGLWSHIWEELKSTAPGIEDYPVISIGQADEDNPRPGLYPLNLPPYPHLKADARPETALQIWGKSWPQEAWYEFSLRLCERVGLNLDEVDYLKWALEASGYKLSFQQSTEEPLLLVGVLGPERKSQLENYLRGEPRLKSMLNRGFLRINVYPRTSGGGARRH
ncbi:MAG: hypothetical protein HY921_01015 [Elusimicrobia bacterium]|nr:hypothetical protein [Elusimicrobiota bacterium]